MTLQDLKKDLPRYMTAIQSIRTVIVGGAVSAFLDIWSSPQKIASMKAADWKQAGAVAAGGAVLALMHHYMQPPNNTVNPSPGTNNGK